MSKKLNIKLLLSFLFVVFFHLLTFAQNTKILTGTVTDVFGDPVIGANVTEKGTTNGTITDLNGNFTLSVSPNSTLVVSYIGYHTLDVPIGNDIVFNIELKAVRSPQGTT